MKDRRREQRRKGPTRVTPDRRQGRTHVGPERRQADRRRGIDRRQLDIIVDYQVRSIPILRCSGRITIGPSAVDFVAKCSEFLQRGRFTLALDLSRITHVINPRDFQAGDIRRSDGFRFRLRPKRDREKQKRYQNTGAAGPQ